MLPNRKLFLDHLAQTSPLPIAIEFEKAKGVFLYDTDGEKYYDLISGIAVSSVGHSHPKIIEAIKTQVDKNLHIMVYGEYVQSPQVQLAKKLAELLPTSLQCTYLVNSGTEAIEGAMKLAKRYTGRTEIISFRKAYHGSTQGSLSISGEEWLKNAFRPLLPDTRQIHFNDFDELKWISNKTACVFVEPIQGEAGVILPKTGFLKKLKEKCVEQGALLVMDEIQTGMARTGKIFAFQHEGVIPDILCLGKAFGGGMPLAAFISSQAIMNSLTHNPVLGHITTFGGHPLSCVAAIAAMEITQDEHLAEQAESKAELFKKHLVHPMIKEIRGKGLLMAVEFEKASFSRSVIEECIRQKVLVDWFLFAENCLRIAPPLTISEKEIEEASAIIIRSIDSVSNTQ